MILINVNDLIESNNSLHMLLIILIILVLEYIIKLFLSDYNFVLFLIRSHALLNFSN